MKQDFTYSTLTAREGINATTSLKAHPNSQEGHFYAQSSGNEDQFQLLGYGLTGTPVLSIPAVTFTCDKFYLIIRPQHPGGFTVHRTPARD